MDLKKLKAQIRTAFAGVTYPGDKNLCGSNEGDEPFMVERVFYGKSDWETLSPEFIDLAPEGLASALVSFQMRVLLLPAGISYCRYRRPFEEQQSSVSLDSRAR